VWQRPSINTACFRATLSEIDKSASNNFRAAAASNFAAESPGEVVVEESEDVTMSSEVMIAAEH
jgi:hypothetical protein